MSMYTVTGDGFDRKLKILELSSRWRGYCVWNCRVDGSVFCCEALEESIVDKTSFAPFPRKLLILRLWQLMAEHCTTYVFYHYNYFQRTTLYIRNDIKNNDNLITRVLGECCCWKVVLGEKGLEFALEATEINREICSE